MKKKKKENEKTNGMNEHHQVVHLPLQVTRHRRRKGGSE